LFASQDSITDFQAVTQGASLADTIVTAADLASGRAGRARAADLKPSPLAGPFAGALPQYDPKTYWLLAPPE